MLNLGREEQISDVMSDRTGMRWVYYAVRRAGTFENTSRRT